MTYCDTCIVLRKEAHRQLTLDLPMARGGRNRRKSTGYQQEQGEDSARNAGDDTVVTTPRRSEQGPPPRSYAEREKAKDLTR